MIVNVFCIFLLQVVPEYDEKKEKEKEEKAKEEKSLEIGKDPFSEFLANNTAGVNIRNIVSRFGSKSNFFKWNA